MDPEPVANVMTIGERKHRLRSIFKRVHDSQCIEHRKKMSIRVIEDVNNYYTISKGKTTIDIDIGDVFLHAPEDILESLAMVIVSKCYMLPYSPTLWHRVRAYLESPDCIERSKRAFLRTSRSILPYSRGDHHDLKEALFRVKSAYFPDPGDKGPGVLGFKDPTIVWSKRRSHSRFGYWMKDYDVIVVNRILDNPIVPKKVVDFIVYHEILHKKHGALNLAGISESHYNTFNLDERKFKDHQEVEDFLAKIYKTRGKCLK